MAAGSRWFCYPVAHTVQSPFVVNNNSIANKNPIDELNDNNNSNNNNNNNNDNDSINDSTNNRIDSKNTVTDSNIGFGVATMTKKDDYTKADTKGDDTKSDAVSYFSNYNLDYARGVMANVLDYYSSSTPPSRSSSPSASNSPGGDSAAHSLSKHNL
eukprot:Awhi_evm1s9474